YAFLLHRKVLNLRPFGVAPTMAPSLTVQNGSSPVHPVRSRPLKNGPGSSAHWVVELPTKTNAAARPRTRVMRRINGSPGKHRTRPARTGRTRRRRRFSLADVSGWSDLSAGS